MSPARKRTQADALSLALRAFVDLSEETKTLICDCNADLYGGPSAPTSDNFRGFVAGTRFLTELLDEVRGYWFDTQSEERSPTPNQRGARVVTIPDAMASNRSTGSTSLETRRFRS